MRQRQDPFRPQSSHCILDSINSEKTHPMSRLPASIQALVEAQCTKPIAEIFKDVTHESMYGSGFYRMAAALLLSGRVAPKVDGGPNMTDLHRIGKEANLNPYYMSQYGQFLVACDVLNPDRRKSCYSKGENFDAFWKHQHESLREITRTAFLKLTNEPIPKMDDDQGLVELIHLFFHCFDGLAVDAAHFRLLLLDFCGLPGKDLSQAAANIKLKVGRSTGKRWQDWLTSKRQTAVRDSLYFCSWVYVQEVGKKTWLLPSPLGLAMFDNGTLPDPPKLSTDFKVQDDSSVQASVGVAIEKLAILCRFSTIKRDDMAFEFKLDQRRIKAASTDSSAVDDLNSVFEKSQHLPRKLAGLLKIKPLEHPGLGIRGCSALIRPDSAEVEQAIRKHPRLKGYIEAGAPPGYLLIKPQSDPHNFVRRCRELGFEVRQL